MASLRDIVSEYQDDLRNGIAWLAFWREGRSWQPRRFTLIWTTPFIQRTGRGLQRYRPPTHGPLWYLNGYFE